MKRYILLLISILLAVPVLQATAQNQDELRQTLFGETDKLLAQVQAEQANLLAPSNFKNAMNQYNRALKDFQAGKKIRDIENKLAEVRQRLTVCLDTAKLGQITFSTSLKAREDALRANAPEYAGQLYEKAESQFTGAAKKLERNDVKGAKKKVPEINKLFRRAELNAIKVSIIGTVRNLIKQAKEVAADKYAPITYANALQLLQGAETILNSDRRSESNAKELAEKAEIEAKHAISLTRDIKRLKKNDKDWERFIQNYEILVEGIAKELGFEAHFDEGMGKPLGNILKTSRALQTEKRELISEVQEKNDDIQKLNEDLQKYRSREQGLQAELQEKQYRLELKRRREERVRAVEEMFASNEAVVLRKGNDLIIRLIGLTFPSGKTTIRPQYFTLLTRVQRALRKFSNSPFAIEGHTDSIGDDRFNQNLSHQRALAVKQYLLANMGLDDSRITALGYGERRPIASNETRKGRAQNRRIDIVITFVQESL